MNKIKKRVFLFGATGYLGGRLKIFLQERGYSDIISVGRCNSDRIIDLKNSNFSSLLDQVSQHDVFVFLAAVSSPDLCSKDFDTSWRINVVNTRTLINELIARNVRVIIASSDVVAVGYDDPATEKSLLRPFGAYGYMKAAIELEFEHEPNFKAARLSYVISRSDRFSSMLYDSVRINKKVDIFQGFNRNVVSCLDVVTGIERLIKNWDIVSSGRICFSGPHLVSRLDIALCFQKIFPALSYSVVEPDESFWSARPKTIEVESKYFQQVLGRKPQSVNDALRMEFKDV